MGYLTVLGALFVPASTVEIAGVLEATLFEVKSGTLLFTVNQRVYSKTSENIWNRESKKRAIRARLLTQATKALAGKVVGKIGRLVAARDRYERAQEPRKNPNSQATSPETRGSGRRPNASVPHTSARGITSGSSSCHVQAKASKRLSRRG